MTNFVPILRMRERADLAQGESDTSYFFDQLYLGEMTLKVLVIELLAGMQDERDRHRHSLEYRLVRANGIGEWADALDEAVTGPPSQHLTASARESQQAITQLYRQDATAWQRDAVNLLNKACRCLDSSIPVLARQRVSIRQWARDFVWLRNRTRGHGAPKPGTLSLMCPSLEQSITLVVENAPAFSRDWTFLKGTMKGKYRISSFGGSREPFNYLSRESGHSLHDGVYVFLGEPRRASLLFSDPDLTDFYFPNGNFRNELFEVISYITDERRDESGVEYLVPAQSRPLSETAASPQLDVIGNAFTNMPPIREGYVRRSNLEADLTSLLLDDRYPVITLQGRGGIGKTSLALEVLHGLANQDRYFAVVWFSARDIDLLPEGPRVVKPDVLAVEDVARDFATLMYPSRNMKSQEAQQYLTDCLSGQSIDGPFLYIFDNFETIRRQGELYAYLSNAVRLPNKVLITTRTRDFKGDYPVDVSGLTRLEFGELVNDVSARLGINSVIDEEYEDELFDESDGHPYIAKILLGEVAREGKRVTFKRVVATKDAVLDALFDRSFAGLSLPAQRVFLTLCAWRSLVPRIGIEAVLLRPGNERIDVGRCLTELEQSSLVEIVGTDDGEGADYLSVPLAAGLFGKRKLVTSPMKLAIDADLELIRGFGATTTTDLAHGLGTRIDRLTRAVAARADNRKDLDQELAVIEYIASEYPPAWLKLADLYEEIGQDVSQSISAVNRYLEKCVDDGDAWARLVSLYRRASDVTGEMHARLQLAELRGTPFYVLSSAANRLNGLLSRRELSVEEDERRLMVRRLRGLMESRHEEANATDLSRLAWLCMRDQDFASAERWADSGLRKDPQNEHCQHLKYVLADQRR